MRLGYLHFPRFPVQRRVVDTPSLAGQPLLLFADDRGTQRVRFASGAALSQGVHPGQTLAAASAVAPAALRLPFDPAAEAAALHALGEALLPLAPGFQVDGPDGLWLDASAAHLSGGEISWAHAVLAATQEQGLVGRFAVASQRFTGRALARFGPPSGLFLVPRGAAANALAPLPLEALEARWLGEGVMEGFRTLGVVTLGELAALSPAALVARYGTVGRQAGRLARGDDDSCFTADALPEVLTEAVRLDWPAEQLEPVLFALKTAVDRLALRLQGRQLAVVRLEAELSLDQGLSLDLSLVLARPSAQGKLLLELLRHRLADTQVSRPVTGVALTVREACADRGRQLVLGDAPAGDAALEVVLARLQSALGPGQLFSARPTARHRPEDSWSPEAFAPPDAGRVSDLLGLLDVPPPPPRERPVSGALRPEPDDDEEGLPVTHRPARLFPEPTPLEAQLTAAGALGWLTLLGRRRRVEATWGPERLAGEWWAEQGFARDYYRVLLEGVGELWVFRDGRDGRFYAQGLFD